MIQRACVVFAPSLRTDILPRWVLNQNGLHWLTFC